jgi:hypothetical protein
MCRRVEPKRHRIAHTDEVYTNRDYVWSKAMGEAVKDAMR